MTSCDLTSGFVFGQVGPGFFAGNHLSLRQHEQKGDFHRLLQDNMAMLLQKATASKYSFQNATSKCYCASTASTVVRSHICWYVQFKGVHARFRKKKRTGTAFRSSKKEPERRSGSTRALGSPLTTAIFHLCTKSGSNIFIQYGILAP